MSSLILQPAHQAQHQGDRQQRRQDRQHGQRQAAERQRQHEQDADRRPEERSPLGGDDRLGRPGHQEREAGQVGRWGRNARRRPRWPRGRSSSCRGRLLFLEPDQEPRLAGLRVPEAAEQLALGRGRDQVELVGDERSAAVGGQRQPACRRGRAPSPARAPGRPPCGSATRIAANPILDGLQLGQRVGRDRPADRHDQLDQADPAEPRLDRVIIADDAGLGPEQVDVVGLVAEPDQPAGQRAGRRRAPRRRSLAGRR